MHTPVVVALTRRYHRADTAWGGVRAARLGPLPLFVFLRRSSAAPLTHVAPARTHGYGEHWTRYALHPFRRAAPDPLRCTRSVALHPIRRGVMPTDRVHHLPQQAQPRAFPPDTPKRQHQTQPHNLEIPARLRTRGATPDPSRYTRSEGVHCLRIGCAPNHKNKRGICETIADTPPTRRRPAPHAANPHRPIQDRCTGGES